MQYYDVYDDSRRYSNDSNTSTSDIMKKWYPFNLIYHQFVRGVLVGVVSDDGHLFGK